MPITEAHDRDRPGGGTVDIIDVEFVSVDGSLAGFVRIDIRPAADATRFVAAVLRPGLEPVVVIDHDLPLARSAFELRAPGIWTELCCEEPLDHWTIGLEAFGLSLPELTVASPASFGDRVPVGLDLDLDTTASPVGSPEDFAIDVRVHGAVLVADLAYEIEATGVRRRRTDGRRPGSQVVTAHPRLRGEISVRWPSIDGEASVERRGWFGGSRPGWTGLPVATGRESTGPDATVGRHG